DELKDKRPGGISGHAVTWEISPSSSSFEVTGFPGSQELKLTGPAIALDAGKSLSVHITAKTDKTSCTTYNNEAEATTTNDGTSTASASEEVKCATIKVENGTDAVRIPATDQSRMPVTA